MESGFSISHSNKPIAGFIKAAPSRLLYQLAQLLRAWIQPAQERIIAEIRGGF